MRLEAGDGARLTRLSDHVDRLEVSVKVGREEEGTYLTDANGDGQEVSLFVECDQEALQLVRVWSSTCGRKLTGYIAITIK